MESNQIDSDLLARYIAGECSSEEAEAVRAWAEVTHERRQFLEDIRRIWSASEGVDGAKAGSDIDVDRDWARLKKRMRAAESERSGLHRIAQEKFENEKQARGTSALVHMMRVAAIIAVLVGGAVLFEEFRQAPTDDATTQVLPHQIRTEPGQRATVRLGDGTRVVLNVDSELRVPRSFNSSDRRVHLSGEAYFDVASEADHPFVIESQKASVTVLGTKFGVRAYSEDQARVVVEEGTVAMGSTRSQASERVTLTAGQMGRLAADLSRVDVSNVNIDNYLSWRDGRLVFRKTRLVDVVSTLERWYDIEGRVKDDGIRDLRLTASLKSRSLRDVLDVISVSLDIDYAIDGQTVIFAAPNTTT